MTLLDVVSWAGCILLLLGLKSIGEKNLSGFYLALFAEVLWIAWGAVTHAYALVAMSIAIVGMYVRAIVLWKRETASS